jgi:hypothetical protein
VKPFHLIPLIFALPLAAQQSNVSSATSVDVNGRRVSDGPQVHLTKSPEGFQKTETMQSVNGRMVPIERVEERVLRDDASGRVVERLIRRYDQTGNPTTPVKQTIEEEKRPDGSSTTQTTTYRGDVNGSMQLIEKAVTQSTKSASGDASDTVIQRVTGNGLETVEKQSKVTVKDANGFRADETTVRKDGNGGFYTAVRKTTEHIEQGSQATDNTAQYEANPAGTLQLQSQTVSTTVKRPDGSKEAVVDIFGQHAPGTAPSDTGKLQLQEQQLIQTTPGPNDSLVETLSVRRPTVSDPKTLGPARQLSQTVCQGNCKP